MNNINFYISNKSNQSTICICPTAQYIHVLDPTKYYFHIERLGTYALNDAGLVSDFNL